MTRVVTLRDMFLFGADHNGMAKYELASDDGYQKLKESFFCMMAGIRHKLNGDLI